MKYSYREGDIVTTVGDGVSKQQYVSRSDGSTMFVTIPWNEVKILTTRVDNGKTREVYVIGQETLVREY